MILIFLCFAGSSQSEDDGGVKVELDDSGADNAEPKMMVVSGGDGYIDFRVG